MRISQHLPQFLIVAMLGLVLILSWDAVNGIYTSWFQDEYSYAYFIPPIALWIGLHRLSDNPVSIGSSWLGTFVLGLGLFFWSIGEISGIPNLPQYGFLSLFYGLFLVFFGVPVVRIVWPALAYLFFAIPLPQVFYLSLSAKMQLISSDLGVLLLQLLSIPVFQDGNIIDLGSYKLQVVEACNGLRYLFPLISFGFLFAILLEDARWKKLFLFLSSIPLAIGLNALRIASIGMVASWGSTETAVMIVHDIEGWVAFFICVAFLYLEADLLLRIPPHGSFADRYLNLPTPPFVLGRAKISYPMLVAAALLLTTSTAYVSGFLSPKHEIIPSREMFASFPLRLANWQGKYEPMDQKTVDLLKATDILNVTFDSSEKSEPVSLFVAYYDSQRDERTFHSPSVCLPGSGWENISSKVLWIDPKYQNEKILHINKLIIEKGSARQLVYYWYEQRGVSEPNFYLVKGRIILDSILRARTDGALVRIVTPIAASEAEEDADKRLIAFLNLTKSTLTRFIPNYSLNSQGSQQ